jgi:hypothetical protein
LAPVARAAPTITFVNVADSSELSKKGSFINKEEIKAMFKYLNVYPPHVPRYGVMSPFRKQAQEISDLHERGWNWRGPKSDSLERYAGSVEDFVSLSFHTALISFAKTEDAERDGGSLLNSTDMIDFILSRVTNELVVFGREDAMTEAWNQAFKIPANKTIEI